MADDVAHAIRCLEQIASRQTRLTDLAVPLTMSHCVETGRRIPRLPCKPSNRLEGRPPPYLSRAIMLADGNVRTFWLWRDAG